MAANTPIAKKQKCEWLVILPDHAGVLAKRMEVRPTHLNNIKLNVEKGLVLWGGGTMAEQPEEGKPLDLNGSALLVWADTKEEVIELVKGDIYNETGVWDLDKMQIIPFKSAVRVAM